MEKRKKHFAAKRAEEKRSKSLTKAQKRKTMSTYLKNMDGMDSQEEAKKMEALIKITPDEEEVAVNAIPLAPKPHVIVDYDIYKEGRVGYYKITRVDGFDTLYRVFSVLLHRFDREDLETLWKLVKARHGETRPTEGVTAVRVINAAGVKVNAASSELILLKKTYNC
ncbi:hypothetical protein Tco_1186012 [Tanacetum coccineum]